MKASAPEAGDTIGTGHLRRGVLQTAAQYGGAGRAPLAGLIEVDETEIPCRSKNDPVTGGGGRSRQGKVLIVGAVEPRDDGAGPGRIRLQEVPNYSADSLHPFIAQNLAPTATAKTDGRPAYPGARAVKHDPRIISKMAAHNACPGCTGIFSNLKRWALGVYHGCAASTCNPISTNSPSASTAAEPDTPLFGIAPGTHPSATNVGLTGS
jgi:ISXO2-like transposase domain